MKNDKNSWRLNIQHTKEYDRFNFLPFNRPTANDQINKLADSISKWGMLRPIIVVMTSIFGKKNGLYIADGQHSFHALVRLGYIIPYVVVTLDRIEDIVRLIAELNNTSKKWNNTDYAKCYAQLNIHEYIKILNVTNSTGISISTLIPIYSPIISTDILRDFGKYTNSFKSGEMKFFDEEKSDDCVAEITYMSNRFKIRTSHFHLAIAQYFYSVKKYSRQQLETKIEYTKEILNGIITDKREMIKILLEK